MVGSVLSKILLRSRFMSFTEIFSFKLQKICKMSLTQSQTLIKYITSQTQFTSEKLLRKFTEKKSIIPDLIDVS